MTISLGCKSALYGSTQHSKRGKPVTSGQESEECREHCFYFERTKTWPDISWACGWCSPALFGFFNSGLGFRKARSRTSTFQEGRWREFA
jgi:hypothetical protein